MSQSGPMDVPVALERRVLRDGVYDRLLDLLLDATLPPDSSLSIDGLARQLAVSPTPVREALVQLENTGLVYRLPLRGYRVAPRLNRRQMESLVDAREIMEVSALERAFASREELAVALQVAVSHQRDVVAQLIEEATSPAGPQPGSTQRFFKVDWGFHQTIWTHADNEFLELMADSLVGPWYRGRQSFGRGIMDAEEAVAEHQAIVDAIVDDDLEQAVERMRGHLAAIAQPRETDRF